MKKIITILSICAMGVFACKKNRVEIPETTPSIQSNQDTALIGTWVCDSIKNDGGGAVLIMAPGVVQDTLYVTPLEYKNITWYGTQIVGYGYQWSTSADSIFAVAHYKYLIAGNKLWTLEKVFPSNINRWYHKK